MTHTNHETEIVVDGDVHVYSCACGYALSEKHDDTTNDHLCDTCNERFTPCNFVDNYCTVCKAFDSPQPVTQTYYPELYETHAGYYVIKNAEQLVWVAEYISSAEDRSMNFVLVTDIEFNKGYDFRFIEDSGLVEITKDGEPIAYVGTGVTGLAIDGGSAVFDTTASVKGTVYTDALGTVFTGSEEESPLAALDKWFPIGRMYFEYAGTFDGNGHKVSGLFMMSGAERVGLIGSTTGTVRNLGVERSFIYTTGTFYGGLVVGLGADVENCYSHGIIVAERIVGGIVGYSN